MIGVTFISEFPSGTGTPVRLICTASKLHGAKIGAVVQCVPIEKGRFSHQISLDAAAEEEVRSCINIIGEVSYSIGADFPAEQDGWDLLMDIISLGKAGQPYKAELRRLKKYVEIYPAIKQAIVNIQEP